MDSFVSRKRKEAEEHGDTKAPSKTSDDDTDTDTKIAILASLLPEFDQSLLLDALVGANGSIEEAMISLTGSRENAVEATQQSAKKPRTIGYQSSLSKYGVRVPTEQAPATSRLTKRGQTLHLFDPDDVAAHTPCSIVHNFLPPREADALLEELLEEAKTFSRASFRIFENIVQSPHSACFYVESIEERRRQQTEYLYNGGYLEDIRQITPQMSAVAPKVKDAVNKEIVKRIKTHYPDQKKLKHQYPGTWLPNAAFVNCYAGGAESVGYHSDQLTYLGPRSVIGSLSLGVARQFRVRKIVPPDEEEVTKTGGRSQADEQGQIAIHLPHNSLLVMVRAIHLP
jgi:alkylated DNA repair dioxygenase AlkB